MKLAGAFTPPGVFQVDHVVLRDQTTTSGSEGIINIAGTSGQTAVIIEDNTLYTIVASQQSL